MSATARRILIERKTPMSLTDAQIALISAKAAERASKAGQPNRHTSVPSVYTPKSGTVDVFPVVDSHGALVHELQGHRDDAGKLIPCGDGSCSVCEKAATYRNWSEV
jgi:hypothetical protein